MSPASGEEEKCQHQWNWDRSRCFRCSMELETYLNSLQQSNDALTTKWNDFMEWLTDLQVVHWTLTEETKNDPKKAVEALLQTYLNEINDSAISEVARKARDYDALTTELQAAREALREIALADGGAYTQDYQPGVDRLADIACAFFSSYPDKEQPR